ncbi:MAG: hypothetical protein WC052_04840 [Patescibacteria group bacterium]|jgi:uncharacterized protein (DUF2384 family)
MYTLLSSIVIALVILFLVVFAAMAQMQRARNAHFRMVDAKYRAMQREVETYRTTRQHEAIQSAHFRRLYKAALDVYEAGNWVLHNPSTKFETGNRTEADLFKRLCNALDGKPEAAPVPTPEQGRPE